MNKVKNFKQAFTLAEVLITIGIIGVVAAMTLPIIIDYSTMVASKSKFKKTMSVLNQAGAMSKAKYGFDFSDATYGCNLAQEEAAGTKSFCGIFSGAFNGYKYYPGTSNGFSYNKTFKTISDTNFFSSWYNGTYQLNDGSIFAFNVVSEKDCHVSEGEHVNSEWIENHTGCLGFIDINGKQDPNKEVSCSDGTETALTPETPCVVKKDSKHLTDIYLIVFHDSVVEPATNASAYLWKN